MLENVLVFYAHIKNCNTFIQLSFLKLKFSDIKQYIYCLTVSVGQESWHGLAGSLAKLQSRCDAGLRSHMEA